MPKIRITKQYKSWSEKAGIVEVDTVDLVDANACARFVTSINANEDLEWEIVDYEVALISKMTSPEIVENPTGGKKGKLIQ